MSAPAPLDRRAWRWMLLALAVVLLVHGAALGHGFVHDDVTLLAESTRLDDLRQLPRALVHDVFWLADGRVRPSPYWRPLVVLSYYLDHAWGRGEAWAFHLTNLLLLAGLAGLATAPPALPEATRRDAVVRAAALVGIVAHPMMSEVALNITARTDLLVALFAMLALRARGPRSLLWTLGALASKESAIVLPLLVAAQARGEGPEARHRWAPHAALTGLWFGVRGALLAGWGVAPEDGGLPTSASVRGAAARVFFYLGRLLWPVHPVAARALPDPGLVTDALAWGALLALGAWLVWPASDARTRPARQLLPLVLLPLIPVSGLLASPVRYAEGFLALPVVGLVLLGAQAASARRWAGLGALALVPWLWITAQRVPAWASEDALWAADRAALPEDPILAGKYGRQVRDTQPELAEPALRQAIAGDPDLRRQREARAHLAQLLLTRGDAAEALTQLRLAADPADPEGTWPLATRCALEAALSAPPGPAYAPLDDACAEAWARTPTARLANARGVLAARAGSVEAARPLFACAVRLAPGEAEYSGNLALAERLLSARAGGALPPPDLSGCPAPGSAPPAPG